MPRPVAVVVRAVARTPAPIRGLSALYAIGALSFVLAAIVRLSPEAPVSRLVAGAIGCAVVAPLTLVLGARWERSIVLVGTLGVTTVLALRIISAHSVGGLTLATFSFQWLVMFCAYYVPRKIGIPLVATALIAMNVAFANGIVRYPETVRVLVTVAEVGVYTVLAHLVAQLRAKALTDQLTGLLNRNGFTAAVASKIPKAVRQDKPVTVCLIDLDDFKAVNDEMGHVDADELLVSLAAAWRQEIGHDDVLARYGGDEFVLVACGTDVTQIHAVIEALRVVSPLGWSVGWAALSDLDHLDEAMREADQMLGDRKSHRRNRISAWTPRDAMTGPR